MSSDGKPNVLLMLTDDPGHADHMERLESLLIEQRDIYSDPTVSGGFWDKYEKADPTKRCTATR